MSYTIVNLPAIKVIGQANKTTNHNHQSASDLPQFWKKYFAKNIEDTIAHKKEPLQRIAVYTDYTPQGYTVIIGVVVTDLKHVPAEGFVARELLAGEYAVFTISGPVETAAAKEWKHILAIADLPRAYINDFELYEYEGDTIRDQKIYVSLKKD